MKTPANIYCEHCGASIEADSKFCAECGNKLHATSADQSQIQSEPPRKTGKDPASTPLVVVGICILVVVVGSLLFSVVQTGTLTRRVSEFFSSTPTSTGRLPPRLPSLASLSEQSTTENCGPVRRFGYNEGLFVAYTIYTLGTNYEHPFIITRTTFLSPMKYLTEVWIDKRMRGRHYEYFDDESQRAKKYPNACSVLNN